MHMNVRAKLLGTSAILIAFMAAIGVISVMELSSVGDIGGRMLEDRVVPLNIAGDVRAAIADMESQSLQAIVTASATAPRAAIDADATSVDKGLAAYEATVPDQTEQAALTSFQTTWTSYQASVKTLLAGVDTGGGIGLAAAKDAYAKDAGPGYDELQKTIGTLADYVNTQAEQQDAAISDAAGTGRMVTILGTLLAAVVGFGLSWLLARNIVRGLLQVQTTVVMLGEKCATWLAEGMEKLKNNDLTYAVTPVTPLIEGYGTDEIGQLAESTNLLRNKVVASIVAYNTAREGLAGTITEVQEAADAVTRTSGQLNEAATQTGAATQQVAQTIGQVAGGTAEQARAAADTNAAVQELSSVIAQVGRGASDASVSVGRSLDAVGRMQSALTASDAAADELKPANERAAAALASVTSAIDENAAGMARIKGAVDQSAVKVAQLGAKGEQIGAIVETIDDIAAQTNLLALNAAIEAARAGEMGKGFAVVADEVRKLAERSGRATKEIADLIAEVQKGTAEAVTAMEAGSAEVEQGLVVGRKGAASVTEISEATAAREAALARVFAALSAIGSAARDVTTSSDDIARVVEQTAQGASTMAAASDSVTRSIGSIAAVSEENSAAAQEVSAATEEMSAQAEEVVASASTLADMAAQLDALVARFLLEDQGRRSSARAPEAMPANVVARRRQADWQRKAS